MIVDFLHLSNFFFILTLKTELKFKNQTPVAVGQGRLSPPGPTLESELRINHSE